jgi:hypothetical protein
MILQSFTYSCIENHQKFPAVQLMEVGVLFSFLSRFQPLFSLLETERQFRIVTPRADSKN